MNLKKVVLYNVVLAIICIAISSCNKKYTCAVNGQPTEIYFAKDYTAAQLTVFDTLCVQNGGVWSIDND